MNLAKNDFEKDYSKLLHNNFYGKTMENVRNRIKIEFLRKGKMDKNINQQSTITFNGIHNSYTNYDSYTFKQKEILMD